MDIWGILVFFFLAFLIMSCCGYCCSTKRRGAVLSTPVVVTSSTHTAPGGYPVTQMAPPPMGYQTNGYPAPYPTQQMGINGQMQMPMPMPGVQPGQPGIQAYVAPYPPMQAAGTMNPPTYDMAVQGGSMGQPNNASYEKQSAYNPSFTAH